MVETSVAPEKTVSYANQYIADVKEALKDEPEKRNEFFQILDYVRTHSDDKAICVARMEELIKDHPNLHLGVFRTPEPERLVPLEPPQAILPEAKSIIHPEAKESRGKIVTFAVKDERSIVPLEAQQTIDPEAKESRGKITTLAVKDERSITSTPDANEGLGQSQTMVGKRAAPQELHKDEAKSYVDAVKEAFRDERGRYDEFLEICNDFFSERFDRTSTIARMKELMKDHQELLLGFSFLFSDDESKITTIPPEPSRTIPPEPSRTIPPEPKRTIPPEPRRISPPEAKRTTIILKPRRNIPTDAAEHHCAESKYCTKRKHDGTSFMDKLKTRFRSLDTHVVESFVEIMNEFEEGTMSIQNVFGEVLDLLYYHEDLLEDFPGYFKRTKLSTNSINMSTRYLSHLTM